MKFLLYLPIVVCDVFVCHQAEKRGKTQSLPHVALVQLGGYHGLAGAALLADHCDCLHASTSNVSNIYISSIYYIAKS